MDIGNRFYDDLAAGAFHIQLAPNGPITGAPMYTVDSPNVQLLIDADGLGVTGYADVNVPSFMVHIAVPADNPDTPGQEELIADLIGSFSHSLATDMGLSVTVVPRPVPLP